MGDRVAPPGFIIIDKECINVSHILSFRPVVKESISQQSDMKWGMSFVYLTQGREILTRESFMSIIQKIKDSHDG